MSAMRSYIHGEMVVASLVLTSLFVVIVYRLMAYLTRVMLCAPCSPQQLVLSFISYVHSVLALSKS